MEGEEAEARPRLGGARALLAGVPGVGALGQGGDRAGRRRGSGAGWLSRGEVTGGGSQLAAPLGALTGPAPSPFVMFLLWFRECGGLWRRKGAGLNLNAQLVRQGVATRRPLETCWREPRARKPLPAAAVAGGLRSSSPPPYWAGLLPAPPLVWGKWRNRGRGSGRAM